VTTWDSGETLRRLEASGLRGRGGGWFPAARKWRAVKAEGGQPVVVANAGEGEPGSIKDRHVLLERTADVLEGLAVACRTVGAGEAFVYFKGGLEPLRRHVEDAIRARPWGGIRVQAVLGPPSYVGGEETAVLEALEGRRAWPRPKPPQPSAVGYQGRPTLVQNVETLARVPHAVRDPEAYRASETTLVSLWGHVRRPGVYEVRLGTPLGEVVEQHGGGAADGIRLLFPAGPSAAPLGPDQAATPLHPDALREAGSGLGTASLLVVGRGACAVSVAAAVASFFARESCGQCPPCTVGTANLSRIVSGFAAGTGRARELDHVAETAGFMAMHGYCAHSRTAAAAVQGALARCREDVAAHLTHGGCPHGLAAVDPFADGSAERAAIEAVIAPRLPLPAPS
jgi:NADH-quinone oxidoreductase subunit F